MQRIATSRHDAQRGIDALVGMGQIARRYKVDEIRGVDSGSAMKVLLKEIDKNTNLSAKPKPVGSSPWIRLQPR